MLWWWSWKKVLKYSNKCCKKKNLKELSKYSHSTFRTSKSSSTSESGTAQENSGSGSGMVVPIRELATTMNSVVHDWILSTFTGCCSVIVGTASRTRAVPCVIIPRWYCLSLRFEEWDFMIQGSHKHWCTVLAVIHAPFSHTLFSPT